MKKKKRQPGHSRHEGGSVQPPGDAVVEEAMRLAIGLHKAGDRSQAEMIYRQVLHDRPKHPDAMHYLGVLMHQRGENDKAIELISAAVAVNPGYWDAHNNLGNIYRHIGRLDEAAAAYEAAAGLAPNHAESFSNLGAVRRAQGRLDEAEAACRRAVELQPKKAEARFNLANVFLKQRKLEAAIEQYRQSIALEPRQPTAYEHVGRALYLAGRLGEAETVYRDWLKLDPDHPIPQHMLAACTGQGVPTRASDQYVRQVFDQFAAHFDVSLKKLQYRAPGLVVTAVGRELGPAAGRLSVLDAGCGTGLCGPELRAYAQRLVGVDLSPGMLERAKQRGVYDELAAEELTAHMQASPGRYDLIVCVDTLVYFGQITVAMAAATKALRPGGLLAFTTERAQENVAPDGYHLNPHGRYSHSRPYLQLVLNSCNFTKLSIDKAVLRMEAGKPVDGWLVLAWKDEGSR